MGTRAWRRAGLAAACAVLPFAAITEVASAKAADPYSVLVFTKNATVGAAEGVAALQASAPADATFDVSADASKFTDAGLAPYEAVVFLNTTGDVLDSAQEAAFEKYFKAGGGFLGIGSAIETEPSWAFFTSILGTRSTGLTPTAVQATVKVADRGHSAGGKVLPEYWSRTDRWYNFAANVRGVSHVIATVDEDTYTGGNTKALPTPQTNDHPIVWCKDYQGGRSFYTAGGNTAAAFGEDLFRKHLGGAVLWAAGKADPNYSDCGATVLANYQQVKISAPPNLSEPIGFDQLPDGRVLQTARGGELRLHDPTKGTTQVIATIPVYTNSEDGLYGPAIDNDFATNKWVYLYYAPPTVRIKKCDGTTADVTTPTGSAPVASFDPCVWTDTWTGYFQLSRFKFVDGATPSLDLSSEQKIMQVSNNRGACCHVAGDIDFDKNNNLWMVTGDDTPAGGGNSGGWAPFNDTNINETQTLRITNAKSGTFTLSWKGETTATLQYNASGAQIQAALEAFDSINIGDILVTGGNVATGNVTVSFRGQYTQTNVPQITAAATLVTIDPTPTVPNPAPAAFAATTGAATEGNMIQAPFVDARRSSQNTNDLRGKILRIKVQADGSYTIPAGNMFAPGTAKTRPEIYAMGFRNPYRIQVDENDVAYITDYSPDSNVPQNFRGPAGTGRVEIVRKPSNYGWPLCVAPNLPYYRWNFNLSVPLDATPTPHECNNPTRGPQNDSQWVKNGGPSVEPGLEYAPPIEQPDIWYSYNDNNATNPLGTPCLASYNGSGGTCPRLFPGLFTGGVAPHGAAKYQYDPSNPNPKKFPAYYDDAVFFAEFGQNTMREIRLDADNKVFKINRLLDCGEVATPAPQPFECDNPEDLQFGADGAFYLLTYGDGFFRANPDAGMYKWEYVKGQRAPSATLTASRTNGPGPLTVTFGVTATDADPGDSLTYAWDFDNNGTVDSTVQNPTHTYTANGVFTAVVTVKDSSGLTDAKSTVITVGNSAPTIKIEIPADGDFFAWGQHIPYRVVVTDPEDASIDCTKVKTTFVLLHDTHGHGEDERIGCSGFLDTLEEDASHGGYIAGGVSVSYTDNGGAGSTPGLTTIEQHVVQIRRQQVEYVQEQSGTSVATSLEPDPTGGQVRTSLDAGDWIGLNRSYNLTNADKKVTFRFAGGAAANPAGSDRAVVEIRTGSQTGPIVQTVTLKSTGVDANTFTSQTFDLTFSGSQRLFFVFRAATGTGAPTGNFGSLNWIEFSGAGAGIPTNVPPVTTHTITPSTAGTGFTGITRDSVITLTATDDVQLTGTEYRVDGGAWTAYSAPFKLAALSGGGHTLEYRSTDRDGNVETAKTVNLVLFPGVDAPIGGSVGATLSLTLGTPATFGAFVPGVAKDYTAGTTATVVSTAGDATLSVADPSATNTGHLVNGSFFLPQKLQAMAAGGVFAPVGGSAAPTALKTWTAPTTNESVPITFKQPIAASDALRTGAYSKTLTFTLSTTTP